MRKLVDRSFIMEMLRDGGATNYCTVELVNPEKKIYGIVRDSDGTILVTGKELKGYIGDIIYPQYDGLYFTDGDYRLKSDRHGLICKWKDPVDIGPKSLDEALEILLDKLESL